MSSQLNQSNTPLEGEAVFTGEWEYHRGWEAVACLINTDQSGTVTYNFSSDIGTTVHHTESFTVTADVTFNKMVTSKANWFQVVYTNGETDQTSFSLVTTFYRQNTEIELDAGDIMAITAESLPLMDGLTATSGNLEVSLEVDNVGLATSANQTTANTSLDSIDTKITTCNTGAVVVSSGTIDLGATDNAVLDSIASNTSDCAVNTNAIGVDTTSIDGKITACNTGAVVVASGTIDLGATDNAVLDSIASNTTGLNNCVSGNEMQVDVVSLPLMDGLTATSGNLEVSLEVDNVGLATSANQTTANASLSSIDGKVTACNTGAVVVASGTTEATQTTHDNFNCNANLQVNNSDLSLGQYLMATTLPVAIASNQSRLNVAQPTSSAYTTSNLNDTGVVAYVFACKLNTLYIMNWAASVAFVRVYDKATAATGSDTPIMKFTLYNYQNASIPFPCPVDFTNGISIRATTVVGDTDTTSPTSNAVSCVVSYTST